MQKLISETLKKHFGFQSFRAQQEEIIDTIISGQDTLVLMPTGGGKSICFQIPALVKDGTTLVISPLISLMRDQVDSLKKNGIEAEFYNSSQSESERFEVRKKLEDGVLKLLYVAPETLFSQQEQFLSSFKYSLVAVDEAHCVSMWGHDFRPEYKQLKHFRQRHSETSFIALTATADKLTRSDIITHLGLKNAKVFLASFDRPNIHLRVEGNKPKKIKLQQILDFLKARKGSSGIIYCLSRKETEEMADFLQKNGISAKSYHAGLDSNIRTQVQQDFLNDSAEIICATIAFGMGIDKSNVRWVIHNNLPKNIEGYYQEIGRAGRDGLRSEAVLYCNYRDVKLLSDFAKDSPQQDVLLEKLTRMLQYSEASTCRRQILLAYFSENLPEKCGKCDVCENPPHYFDGTLLAQKALSAAKRAGEQLATLLLIDVLRGAKTIDIFEKKLEQLKTYGAGAGNSWKEWSHYITEMKNQGLFEVAYDENMHLKVTELGEDILFGRKKLQLSNYVEKTNLPKPEVRASKTLDESELLFDRLKLLRKKLAVAENVPPYIIFSDVTLLEMCKFRPNKDSELLEITGVGEVKAQRYGENFMSLIEEFEGKKKKSRKNSKENTYEVTLKMLQGGLSIDDIAKERTLSETTIFSHIAKLYMDQEWNDIAQWIDPEEVEKVEKAVNEVGSNIQLRPIFENLNEEIPYGKIRLAIVYLDRKKHLESINA
jgi:ATP-dependent DNA helicase RecQ